MQAVIFHLRLALGLELGFKLMQLIEFIKSLLIVTIEYDTIVTLEKQMIELVDLMYF